MSDKITAYKGFDKDLRCRGYAYEIGKEYEHDGEVEVCASGFHACTSPLEVFSHYAPGDGSRYCLVEQSGEMDRESGSSKVASQKIKIAAELGIPGLVKAHVEYVKAHTTTEHTDPERATAGEYGAATAGNRGAATARGSVSVGKNGCGLVRGDNVKIKGGPGAVLVICKENENNYDIKDWLAFIVDGVNIKPDTWYTLQNGELKEVTTE